jgi:hypothetical protein
MVAPSLSWCPFRMGSTFAREPSPHVPKNIAQGQKFARPSRPSQGNAITASNAPTRFAKGPQAVMNNLCLTR